MKPLSIVTKLSVFFYCLLIIYGTSIPGGGTMGLSFAVVALFFPLVALYLWTFVASVLHKRLYAAVWILPAVFAVTAIIVATGLVKDAHWHWIQHDLENAIVADECPERVGIAAVHDCTRFGADPAYDLGSGFLDLNYLTQSTELPANHEVKEEFHDGWRLVIVKF
ncbi:hypothetical protein QVA66_01610 [Staphylococcus chromogenes]|nr:hypothetical protein [Staphylococcus chromogenes]